MIPGTPPVATNPAQPAPLLPPDEKVKQPLEAWEMGGIAISDPSKGLVYQWWYGWAEADGSIWLAPNSDLTNKTKIITVPGLTSMDFAFDQNMRPSVCYMLAGVAHHYWYDTNISGYSTTQYAGVTSPRLTLDDKRAFASALSDVLLFYIKANADVCFRVQRERFATEYVFSNMPGAISISRLGMTNANRIQVDISK